MKLDKSKKYIIIGIAHNGTCSLEKYMVSLNYDVIRAESAYNSRTLDHFDQLWSDRVPIMIFSKKTTRKDHIKYTKYWKPLNPIILKLSNLTKDKAFPWENKDNEFIERPNYQKVELI